MSRSALFASLWLAVVALSLSFTTVAAQVSGSSRLDLFAYPIVCTQVGEIKLDTPCEQTILKFDIEHRLNLNVTLSGLTFSADTAIGIAGPEHGIFSVKSNLGALQLKDELWFAVPFETTPDVNTMSNIVVIPPGDTMFVKKRVEMNLNIAGINLSNLAMFEDVTFPNPNSEYGADRLNQGGEDCDGDGTIDGGTCVGDVATNTTTEYVNQTFGFGDIITLQGQTVSGLRITSRTGFCADNGSNSVKKFSAPGRVNPECVSLNRLKFDFESISISGISIGGVNLSQSFNFTLDGGTTFQSSTGVSFTVADLATISLSLDTTPPFSLGGISVRLAADSLNLNLSFTPDLELSSASAAFQTRLSVGGLTSTFSANLRAQKGEGITGLNLGMSLSQGTFSSNQSASFVRNGDEMEFASLNVQLNVRAAPVVFTTRAVFGSNGLTQLAISGGVVF